MLVVGETVVKIYFILEEIAVDVHPRKELGRVVQEAD